MCLELFPRVELTPKAEGTVGSLAELFWITLHIPKDPITERQKMIGVSNHLQNEEYLSGGTHLFVEL